MRSRRIPSFNQRTDSGSDRPRRCAERRTIVGPQAEGRPYSRTAARSPDHATGADRRHDPAAQQKAAIGIAHRQGIAARPIAGPEPALEVDAPSVVGCRSARTAPGSAEHGADAGAASPAPRNQKIPHRARRRPRNLRMIQLQPSASTSAPPTSAAHAAAPGSPPRLHPDSDAMHL